jgi:hypothetical protein
MLIREQLLSEPFLEALGAGKGGCHRFSDRAALEVTFDAVCPPLRIAPPQAFWELPALYVALAAVTAAVAGMFLLTPLTRLLLDMRDVGLFLGPPLGALILVIATIKASESKWLRATLLAAFGVSLAAEVWSVFTGGGILRRIWQKLGGRRSGIKRILIYIAIIFLLVFARRKRRYDREGHERAVKEALMLWTESSAVLLAHLWLSDREVPATEPGKDEIVRTLGARIRAIHEASREDLPAAADELIQEARNLGFDGFGQSPRFLTEGAPPVERRVLTWNEQYRRQFRTYGAVENGDQVTVETEPVIFEGEVREKGLVRKVRG